jgi:methylthioribose-1-phosphate isomerase
MRSQDEVLDIQLHGEQVVPAGSTARNPAFDITPHHLISGYVTELGVIMHPFEENIISAIQQNRN